eukprot:SAG11_NODE_1438_length_4908_cov_22.894157_6_plen_110_part_00
MQAVGRAAQQQLGSNFRQLQEANQSAVRLIAELSSQQQDRLETSRAEQMEVARRTAAVQDAARVRACFDSKLVMVLCIVLHCIVLHCIAHSSFTRVQYMIFPLPLSEKR